MQKKFLFILIGLAILSSAFWIYSTTRKAEAVTGATCDKKATHGSCVYADSSAPAWIGEVSGDIEGHGAFGGNGGWGRVQYCVSNTSAMWNGSCYEIFNVQVGDGRSQANAGQIPSGSNTHLTALFYGADATWTNINVFVTYDPPDPDPEIPPGPIPPLPPPTGTTSCTPETQGTTVGQSVLIQASSGSSSYSWSSDGDPNSDNDPDYDTTFLTTGWHSATVTTPNGQATCQVYVNASSGGGGPPGGGSVSADLQVDGSDGPITVAYGTVVELQWTSDAYRCYLWSSGDDDLLDGGTTGPDGTMNQTVLGTTTYYVECTSLDYTVAAQDNVVVNVINSPPNEKFAKGYAFEDYDRDGVMESGEPKLSGVPIQINTWVTNSGTNRVNLAGGATDGSGYYSFGVPGPALPNLDSSECCYMVTASIPPGFTSTDPSDDDPNPSVVGALFSPNITKNFGFFRSLPPIITTDSATNVSLTAARLNGWGNARGSATTGWFRYSETDPGTCNNSFGTRVPASGGTSLGSGAFNVDYLQNISGLTPNATYYYCAIGSNVAGTAFGSIVTFTTNAAPPHITLNPPTLTFNGVTGGATPAAQTVTLSNSGNLVLNWSASTNEPWCHVAPIGGSLGGSSSTPLSVTVDAPSNVGSFPCTLTVSGNADNSPQTVAITYNVIHGQRTLTVSKAGTGSGMLTSPGINCGADCSEIYDYDTTVTVVGIPTAGSSGPVWSGDCNAAGLVVMTVDRSCTATFTIIPPSAPSGVSANPLCGYITLNWDDNSNSPNETGFYILRATNPTGPFNNIGSVGQNVETYQDNTAALGTDYYYKIQAYIGVVTIDSTNTIGPVHRICIANLLASQKNIFKVGGVAYTPNTVIRNGDTVTFRVVIRNDINASSDATIHHICDTPSSNFKFLRSASVVGGPGTASVDNSPDYCPPGQIEIDINGVVLTPGSSRSVEFDTDFVTTGAGSVELCSNDARIRYDDSEAANRSHLERFGPTFCNKGSGKAPEFEETAP